MAKYPQLIKKSKQIKIKPQIRPIETFSFDKAFSYENLAKCYKKATRGHRGRTKEAIIYDLYDVMNLEDLEQELQAITVTPRTDPENAYEVGPYHHTTIYEPKERSLNIPALRDKIVQLATHEPLQELFRPTYILRSYACLTDRGQIRAALDTMHNLRCAKAKWGDKATIVRFDARKFFYSIDRNILKKIIRKHFSHLKKKHPEMYLDLLRFYNLLCKIIDSSPEGEKGIPLGNVTSQDFANIYFNELDLYCVRFLGIIYYTRYMDDIVIVAPDKETAKQWLDLIVTYAKETLHLDTNQKTKIFNINQGVNAFGYKIKATHMTIRTASKRGLQRKLKHFSKELAAAEEKGTVLSYPYMRISQRDEVLRRCQESTSAWIGFARWSCSFNLVKKMAKKYPELPIYTKSDLPFGAFCRMPKNMPHNLALPMAA